MLLLSAGCLSGTDSADEAAASAANEAHSVSVSAPLPVTHATNGSITGVGAGATAAGFYLCCISAHQQGDNLSGSFQVGGNLTRIVVELEWVDPWFDLDLLVMAPDYEFFLPPQFNATGPRLEDTRGYSVYAREGTLGQPDGHAIVEIKDPEALALVGDWHWEVRSKTARETAFQVRVSLE